MNKKYLSFLMMLAIGLSACGQTTFSPIPPNTPADLIQQDINALISQKNADRAILAQAPLTSGLSCTVQQVTGGGQCLTWHASYTTTGCTSAGSLMTTSGTTYTYLYSGSFDQPNSSGSNPILLLPASLRPLFQGTNFKIVCTGQIVVTESNYYNFSLNSDDGSLLYVNGVLVVNNDNNHGMTLRSGSTLLYRGVQSFQIQYAQTGGGNFGLILQAGNASVSPRYFYH